MTESSSEQGLSPSGSGPEPIPGNKEFEERSNNSAQISSDEPEDDYEAPDLSAGAQVDDDE